MAIRIGHQVIRGELDNSRNNSVRGWIELVGSEPIQLKLSGNIAGDLCGCLLCFQTRVVDAVEEVTEDGSTLECRQIGVIGDVFFHERRVPRCGAREFAERTARGESPPVDIKPCLYLEWYGPNGRVVAELVDPVLDVGGRDVEAEPLPPEGDFTEQPGIEIISLDGDRKYDDIPFGNEQNDDDPYGLFPADLDEQLRSHTEQDEQSPAAPDWDSDEPAKRSPRDWADVIPGIDPKTQRMYEEWDEILHGENHVPLATLFDPPLKLPPVDEVSREQAADLVRKILAELAKYAIKLDVCEHFNEVDCYRVLVESVLPEAHISPLQPGSGFVTHYSTYDWCRKCAEEFDD